MSEMTLTQDKKLAIRAVVQEQLRAFQADDSDAAFVLAAPSIRQKLKTADSFLTLIKTNYYPIYRPRSVVFESSTFFRIFLRS
ncbi:MAG: DUF4864 domain-containing protein [Leptolyngbyaceae cyanobacterium SL_1_1]|nr:DUF4864 domain-containing protein [Leptolyngbyaceae cyanobacterium SL_1_1]